jgi:hypothetical protein
MRKKGWMDRERCGEGMHEKEGMDEQRVLGGGGRPRGCMHQQQPVKLFFHTYVLIGPRHPLWVSKCKFK